MVVQRGSARILLELWTKTGGFQCLRLLYGIPNCSTFHKVEGLGCQGLRVLD